MITPTYVQCMYILFEKKEGAMSVTIQRFLWKYLSCKYQLFVFVHKYIPITCLAVAIYSTITILLSEEHPFYPFMIIIVVFAYAHLSTCFRSSSTLYNCRHFPTLMGVLKTKFVWIQESRKTSPQTFLEHTCVQRLPQK